MKVLLQRDARVSIKKNTQELQKKVNQQMIEGRETIKQQRNTQKRAEALKARRSEEEKL